MKHKNTTNSAVQNIKLNYSYDSNKTVPLVPGRHDQQ